MTAPKHSRIIFVSLCAMILITLLAQAMPSQASPENGDSANSMAFYVYSFYIASVSEGYSLEDWEIQNKNYGYSTGVALYDSAWKNGVNRSDLSTNFIIVKSPGGLQLTNNQISLPTGHPIPLTYYSGYQYASPATKLRVNSGGLEVGYQIYGGWNPNYY